jgi:predicted acyltransferase
MYLSFKLNINFCMKNRFYSLDVFRGMTVALMILVNTPGSWDFIYPPLKHASWHGLTPTDLVFPFFLFAVGNAMAFVMPKFYEVGDKLFWPKVLKRTALIFLIGLFLNWFPFIKWQADALVFKPWQFFTIGDNPTPSGVRVLGVLQRIAICYFFASVIVYYAKLKGAAIIAALILLGYWAICYFGNTADPYSLSGWIGTNIDKAILSESHMYKGEKLNGTSIYFDPEGLLSTLPAIAHVILGYFAGFFIKKWGNTEKTVLYTLIAGIVLFALGHIWGYGFPINKKIWTSSYVFITTGMGLIVISTLIYLFEIIKVPQLFGKFFDAFGKNPLFIFVLSGALPRLIGLIRIPNGVSDKGIQLYTSPFSWFYEHVCKNIGSDLKLGSFIYAIIFILLYWLICYIMDKKKIYIKV